MILLPNSINYKFFDKLSGPHHRQYKVHGTNRYVYFIAKKTISQEFNSDNLVLVTQIHRSNIVYYDEKSVIESQKIADGIITTKRKLAIAIKTADCVPVLIYNKMGSIIANLHCGWRGVKSGIITEAINEMKKITGSNDFYAIIGPAIQQKSYEVDNKFKQEFMGSDSNSKEFFITVKGSIYFDLPGYVSYKLEKNNVEVTLRHKEDTYEMHDIYPSYRKACHLKQEENFAMVSVMMMS